MRTHKHTHGRYSADYGVLAARYRRQRCFFLFGSAAEVESLLAALADINVRNSLGETPLMIACDVFHDAGKYQCPESSGRGP